MAKVYDYPTDDEDFEDEFDNPLHSDADRVQYDLVPASSAHTDVDLSYFGITLLIIKLNKSYLHDYLCCFAGIDAIPNHYLIQAKMIKSLSLHHNSLLQLPPEISAFESLVALDISSNQIAEFPLEICQLQALRILIAKNNMLDGLALPKTFSQLNRLEVINFSGNRFLDIPAQIFELPRLKALYMGGNQLQLLPCRIGDMQK